MKRLTASWAAPKWLTATAMFLMLALLVDFLLVLIFLSFGLTEKAPLTAAFPLPLTNWFLVINISPLFHLIPFGVIVVLVSSWIYLTKNVAVVPRRIVPSRKAVRAKRRGLRKKTGLFGQLSRSVDRKLQHLNRPLKAISIRAGSAALRIPGISRLKNRISLARGVVRVTIVILTVFFASILALYLLVYPSFLYETVIGFYSGNPSFHGFVLNTIFTVESIGRLLYPVGQLGSIINNSLLAAAPGFRKTLENIGSPMIQPFLGLDLAGKYLFCQNVAAWVSATTALTYGKYGLWKRPPRLR